jgi:hypothetical protein
MLPALIGLLGLGGCPVNAANVALMEGVAALADSQHRDRWGVDGYHPWLACDGQTDPAGGPMSAWLSDNWEVTHSLALVFPRRVRMQQAVIHWGGAGYVPLRFTLQALRQGQWVDLAEVDAPAAEASTTVSFNAVTADAVKLTQPAGSAAPGGDRRLRVAELEVVGEPLQPAVAVDVAAVSERIRREMRDLRRREDDERVAPVLAVAMQPRKTRGFMGAIDRDDLQRGRANVATRQWAKTFAEAVIKDADWWVARDDEYIYKLIPEGNPRAICPSFELGDPIHGGARQSFTATLEAPYQWKSNRGGEVWYDGATIKNPGTGEKITVHDDGSGWVAPEGFLHPGRRYYFVAAYRYYLLGKLLSSPYEGDGGSEYQGGTPVVQLALAYAITGDARYAHKCAVMLNRLAELYHTYDGCVEGPSQRQDGYIGQTFERFLVQNLILAADLIWDEVEPDAALHGFFAARGNTDYDGDGQATGADFTYNLQHNLLGYIYEYLHRLMPYFDGDFLMYEMTGLAELAKCLGNGQIAAEALESDTGLRVLLGNSWFRDGKFIYDSAGYNVGNAQTPLWIAEYIHGLQAPPRFEQPVDVYNHPEYRISMLYDFLRNIDCDGRLPCIGDGGGARTKSLNLSPPYQSHDERAMRRLAGQHDTYLSRLQAASGGKLEAFRNGRADWWLVFHADPATPEEVSGRAEAPPAESHLFDDSGIAILRAGARPETREHVCLTFSKGAYGHGHPDKLALNVFRYGYDFSADLGYPTTWTDIKCGGWEKNTASHCTVMLDESGQRGNVIGALGFYAAEPLCDAVEASAEGAYPQCSLYRRTVALVRDSAGEPLYTADVFRMAGARTRDYLFHSLGQPEDLTVTVDDPQAAWTKQERGSLAGEDVEPMTKGGYGFLFDLARTRTAGAVSAVWRPTTGMSQPDRYLLTKDSFENAVVEFTLTRTGQASGPRERSVFVFATDPSNVGSRRVIMLPVEAVPVGEAVPVRVELTGPDAKMTIAGKPQGHVDVAGAPSDSGSLGFLHYYNYAWDIRDLVITPAGGDPIRVDLNRPLDPAFWGRIEPTYEAGGGVLKVRDAEAVQFHLRLLGAPGREVIRAKAEGYGIRGQSPFEGHVIVRDQPDDPAQTTTFVAVMEAVRNAPRVTALKTLSVTPTAEGVVALQVDALDADGQPRTDIILSALDEGEPYSVDGPGGPVDFQGRFGIATLREGKVTGLMLVGVGRLACAGRMIEQPAAVRGVVKQALVAESALDVELDTGSAPASEELIGRRLLVTNPAFVCPAVYTVTRVEQAGGGLWRLGLNMPLVLARGVVSTISQDGASFASRTPVMKLRVNPGLFDGKLVRKTLDGPEYRLRTATEAAFTPEDPAAVRDFQPGDEYLVCDVGVGDRVEVVPHRSQTYP